MCFVLTRTGFSAKVSLDIAYSRVRLRSASCLAVRLDKDQLGREGTACFISKKAASCAIHSYFRERTPIMKLKWTKADWNKDQMVGQKDWAQKINGAAQMIEVQLDIVQKVAVLKNKKQKKIAALKNIADLLNDYLDLDALQADKEAQMILLKRSGQVAKALKRYEQEFKFTYGKLKLESVIANSTLRDSLHDFLTTDHSVENLDFIIAVNNNTMTEANIIATFVAQDAPRQVNLNSGNRKSAEQGIFTPGVTEILSLIRKDAYRRFLNSKQLLEAIDKISVIP